MRFVESANGVNHINQQASCNRKCLPDFILEFQAIFTNIVRAFRLQLRCNPDWREDGAYTSFPSNLRIGEAGGHAPV